MHGWSECWLSWAAFLNRRTGDQKNNLRRRHSITSLPLSEKASVSAEGFESKGHRRRSNKDDGRIPRAAEGAEHTHLAQPALSEEASASAEGSESQGATEGAEPDGPWMAARLQPILSAAAIPGTALTPGQACYACPSTSYVSDRSGWLHWDGCRKGRAVYSITCSADNPRTR